MRNELAEGVAGALKERQITPMLVGWEPLA